MKTSSERQPESFRPLTASFTIETQEELDTLHEFFSYDLSIPREYSVMSSCDIKKVNLVQQFMTAMCDELNKNV